MMFTNTTNWFNSLRAVCLAGCLLLCLSMDVFGQDVSVNGKVLDEDSSEPIPGVTILIKGQSQGTVTDIDGNYSIVAASDAVLTFSFVGYTTQEVPIGGRSTIDVRMPVDVQSLEEVVVIGYGTQKRSDVTGAIASVSSEEISEIPSAGLANSIQGRIAGVTLTRTSSRPGAGMEIRIRGERSLPQASSLGTSNNNSPLIVVDGIPYGGNLNDINQNDIKSLDVLKDASATAIYGSRGANGVIIITTKRGTAGALRLSYNAYFGTATALGKHDVMNGEEYSKFIAEANFQQFTDTELESITLGRETDWQELVMKDGYITSHDLNLSGGTETTQYSVSAGYFEETTVFPGQDFDRLSLRAVLDQQIGERIKVGINAYNSFSNRSGENANPMFQLLTMSPLYVPYNEDGSINEQPAIGSLDEPTRNPLLLYRKDAWAQERRRFRSFNSLYGEIEILEGLKYRLNVGLDFTQEKFGDFRGSNTPFQNGGANFARVDNNDTRGYTLENVLTYTKTFATDHTINFTALYSRQYEQYTSISARTTDVPADYLLYYDLGLANGSPSVNANESAWGLESWMARLNYNYADRYLLTVSSRWDGSSRLAEGNKWFNYYAAAGAWNIHNESFLSTSQVSNLKLRAGYGIVSNQAISPYTSLGSMGQFYYNYGSENKIGYAPVAIPNPALTWEFTTTTNFGVDLGLFNNRVNFVFDWYQQQTSDVLQDKTLTTQSGVRNPILENIGKTKGSGIEMTLGADIVQSSDGLNWNMSANWSTNRTEIEFLSGRDTLGVPLDDPGNMWFVGESINALYDYKKVGIWQTDADEQEDPYLAAIMTNTGLRAGDIRVEDVNGDSVITADDRTIIGTTTPDWELGWTNRVSYKNFDLSVVMYYRKGGTLVSTLYQANLQAPYNSLEGRRNGPDVNYWTPDNPSNEYPRTGDQQPVYGSTLAYFDATFMKVRTISLGYTLPESILDKVGVSSARAYVSVNNPFKAFFSPFVDHGGLDPEPTGRGNNSTGIAGFGERLLVSPDTPPTRQIIFGVNLSF